MAAGLAGGRLLAQGREPAFHRELVVRRECAARNAQIVWRATPGALGYNVRWGVRPDRLTLTSQLFADRLDGRRPSLSLRALNFGQAYFVAVEAFNETGVSPLSRVVPLAASCDGR